MTVGELKKFLMKCNDDAKILIADHSNPEFVSVFSKKMVRRLKFKDLRTEKTMSFCDKDFEMLSANAGFEDGDDIVMIGG